MKHTFTQVPPEEQLPYLYYGTALDDECERMDMRIFDCGYLERFKDHSCTLVDRIEGELRDKLDESDDTYGDDVTTDMLLEALEVETGEPWEESIIRGSSQGEWRRVLHRVALREFVRGVFSVMYWNEGSEWTDEDGCGYYSCEWGADAIKRDLADCAGVDPADVVLREFTGWSRSAEYREL